MPRQTKKLYLYGKMVFVKKVQILKQIYRLTGVSLCFERLCDSCISSYLLTASLSHTRKQLLNDEKQSPLHLTSLVLSLHLTSLVPGSCFSKVLIISWPGKLLFRMEV